MSYEYYGNVNVFSIIIIMNNNANIYTTHPSTVFVLFCVYISV